LKDAGNEEYKKNNLHDAIKDYTGAIELDPHNKKLNATLYANRAAANFKLKKY